MSDLQKHQLLPPVTFPDDLDPKTAKIARLIYGGVGKAFQDLLRLIDSDPRMSDTRIAHGVSTQQGDVEFDYATLPTPGQVLYAVDGGRRGVWGDAANPAPTGGGIPPLLGANHNILSATHTDSLTGTVVRGDLIVGNSTPKWARLAKPSVPSVLKNDATDAAWVTIPTRRIWIPAIDWATGVVGGIGGRGTDPDVYYSHTFPDLLDIYIDATVEVPDNWISGTITAKAHWTTAVQLALNWVPHFYYLERVDGDDMTAAGTHITGPTTSANFAPDILKITTIGTFTPGAAGRLLRLTFARLGLTDANDTYTDEINLIGVELSYTPSY